MLKEKKLEPAKNSVLRLMACQALCVYDSDFCDNKDIKSILNDINSYYMKEEFMKTPESKTSYGDLYKSKFLIDFIKNIIKNFNEFDDIIEKELRNFTSTINNLLDTTKESFRLAVYELKNNIDTPTEIIINEYVDIIAELTNDKSETKFANKVLDNLANTIRNNTNKEERKRKVISLKTNN